MCRHYRPCEFLGFVWTDCWGDKYNYVITSPANRSLVRPSLEYCAAVWDPYTVDQIYHLEAVQRRAAHFVKNYDRHSSVTAMMQELNWPHLATRRKIARICLFQKAYEGHLAVPVRNLLHPVTRFTRNLHSKSFIPPQPSKDIYKYSFFPQAVNDWNALSRVNDTDNWPSSIQSSNKGTV